jgi:hypothetical protein
MDIIKKIGKAIVNGLALIVVFLFLIIILAGVYATINSILDDRGLCVALIMLFILWKIFEN